MAKKIKTDEIIKEENIIIESFENEMNNSYIDYAMSVIVSRALPDVRDGLKPVQRRILYDMDMLGLKYDKPYKKNARIVGDTMGKYHPHGDSSIYGALVHMSQNWVYNQPLIDAHGNMGSIEGDGAAAMRYTEARLSEISQETLLGDLDKNTISFISNYDDTEKEPEVLPSSIPNLLISGSEGIAVGMACSIPSHNLGEVIDAVQLLITNKNTSLDDLLSIIKGPDFATGGTISNKNDLYDIYKTGNGKVRIRGTVEAEEKNGKSIIKITEIPSTMIGGIDRFMTTIANLVRDKKAPDITDISNLSGKDGISIIIELKKGSNVQKNINLLYKKAKLEDTFSFNMLAVKNKEPKVFSLIDYLNDFIEFQIEINTKKYECLLKKQLHEREIKEGLLKAIDCIDLIIEILRGSKIKKDARDCLILGKTSNISFKSQKSEKLAAKLSFTEIQTDAILSMPLQNLIGLEIAAIQEQLDFCNKNIIEYEGYLNSPVKMRNKIKSNLQKMKDKYGVPRKTKITNEEIIVLEKDEVIEQDYYLLIDRFRYIKLIDEPTYQRNIESIKNDYKNCIKTSNIDKIYLFTDIGKLHQIKTSTIPLCKYKDKGTPLENISNLLPSEEIIFIENGDISLKKYIFVNSQGYSKVVKGEEFISANKTIAATKLIDDIKLKKIYIIEENFDELLIISKKGYFIRFKISEISEMKKTSVGVRCIKLKDDDIVNNCFYGNSKDIFKIEEQEYPFNKIKITKRDNAGIKSKL